MLHFINKRIKNTLQNALFWKLIPPKNACQKWHTPKYSRPNWHTIKNNWKSTNPPPSKKKISKFQNFDPQKLALAYVAGRIQSIPLPGYDLCLVKLSSSGNFRSQWPPESRRVPRGCNCWGVWCLVRIPEDWYRKLSTTTITWCLYE